MIKVSDFIVKFIANLGVKHVFTVSGAGDLHLLDSLRRSSEVDFICNHHEQASAMAAFSYARATSNIGVCIVTTGPGATNAITGMIDCWVDSVPGLYLSGQVQRKYMIGDLGIRQNGIQEINIVDIVKPVTKYAALVDDPMKIKWFLEKAVFEANHNRRGPSWLDIPMDIQSSFVDESLLMSFTPPLEEANPTQIISDQVISKVVHYFTLAKRPIFLLGFGIKAAGAEEAVKELCALWPAPLCVSWSGMSLIPTDHKRYVGRFGTYGQRGANFAVQNCDLLLSIGSRLNITQTGYKYDEFAREAKKIYVDIDQSELDKYPIKPDMGINCDAKVFIEALVAYLKKNPVSFTNSDLKKWHQKTENWKKKYPINLPEYKLDKEYINSFTFMDILTSEIGEGEVVIPTASGSGFTSFHQAARVKKNQIIYTSNGFAEMGFDIPGAIGASVASGKRVWQVTGDGGVQMNIQELQTVIHYGLPIKLFILNNGGYLTIRQTQNSLFNGSYSGSNSESGVSLPSIKKIALAYGIPYFKICNAKNASSVIQKIGKKTGPCICEVFMNPEQPLIPKTSFKMLPDGKLVSPPIEDLFPFLSREEFKANMIIAAIDF